MKIKRLKIEHFRHVDHFEKILDDWITIINDKNAGDIMLAITSAYTELIKQKNIVGISNESLKCSIFTNSPDEKFSERLQRYRQYSDYYSDREFDKMTDSFGQTNVFRSYLKQFINDFEPYLLFDNKNIEVRLEKGGVFFCVNRLNGRKICLSKQESIIFELFCFNKLHEFWEGAARLRTLDAPSMPVIIGNVFEHLDFDRKKNEKAIKGVLSFNNQVIVFDSSNS